MARKKDDPSFGAEEYRHFRGCPRKPCYVPLAINYFDCMPKPLTVPRNDSPWVMTSTETYRNPPFSSIFVEYGIQNLFAEFYARQ